MNKPVAEFLESYDIFDIQDYLDSVNPGLGSDFAEEIMLECSNDTYKRIIFDWEKSWFNQQKCDLYKNVAEAMGWEKNKEIVFWVSW